MKVGFIGCGHIARVHLRAVNAAGGELVGLTDQFPDYARQFAGECGDVAVYESARELIEKARPDVVHVLTPPATHYQTARECLDAGCHVLVEKPMAMTPTETQSLMDTATRSGRMLSVDHNFRFDPVVRRAREMFNRGKIGRLVSVEVDYGFDVNRYPALLQEGAEKSHWVFQLNGGPLEDQMAHPLSLVLEYLDKTNAVTTYARNRGVLPRPWDDEIRVIIDAEPAHAEVYVSFGIKPDSIILTLRGSDGTIVADLYSMTVVVDVNSLLPRAAARGLIGFHRAAQHAWGAVVNGWTIATGRFGKVGGVNTVVTGFYDAVRNSTEPPVTMQEGHAVVDLIHRIWPQPIAPVKRSDSVSTVSAGPPPKVLVTGASGFVGSHLVQKLVEKGEAVRAFVRPSSYGIGHLQSLGCEIAYGDLSNPKHVRHAMEGIEIVHHIGGAMGGGWDVHQASTVQGTRNILAAAKETKPKRIVYFSSLVVYQVLGYRNGTVIKEDHPHVTNPEHFGPYAMGKVAAERLVQEAQRDGVSTTIIRPGIVIGPRGRVFFPHLGFKLKDKLFIILGKGNARLPLVYVDNLVEGTILAGQSDAADGQVYNLVDDGEITVLDYIRSFINQTKLGSKYMRLPFLLPYCAAGVYEVVSSLGLLKKGATSRRQLKWKHKQLVFSADAAKRDLAWKMSVPLDEAVRSTFDWYVGTRR